MKLFYKRSNNDAFRIETLTLGREILMLFTICSAQGMVQAALAQSFIPNIVIGESFHAKSHDTAWYPAAYGLTCGAFMLACGRVGDIVGHKKLFVGAWFWFSLWSLIAGISSYTESQVFFDVCRAFQGIAAAALVPCSLAILGTIYKPGPRKNLAFSLYASGAPIGFTLGAAFSGLLAELAAWPWAFYISSIVCLIYGLLALISVPDLHIHSAQEKGSFDYKGTFIIIPEIGLILLNFAWNRAPEVGWASSQCIAPLIISLFLITIFFPIEKKATHPIIPVAEIDRNATWILLIEGLGWSSFGILCYYSINFIIHLRGDSMLLAAAYLAPVPPAGLAASILTSNLLSCRVNPAAILAFSLIWFCVGNIILATMSVHQSYWLGIFWSYLLSPFGMDMSFPAGTIILSDLMAPEKQGIAASLIATIVYYSQSLGLGLAGVVEKDVANGSVLQGYRGAWYLAIGLSGLGLGVGTVFALVSMSGGNPGFSLKKRDHKSTQECPESQK
ncbi:uncharacterized protein N7483_002879 [Penicillium malachiteum]|uniref:uncharacterized protein n=1 Tax=Penicillium malachiteum TaxID=1324776 RepID=UPI0025489C8B|nr:uncharacterized protein N7483_002879 [Penicillium malachiteum]KAJ5737754.1 hypothetical protein N7483_002879 [Penicillium malachiteum]